MSKYTAEALVLCTLILCITGCVMTGTYNASQRAIAELSCGEARP